MAYKRINKLNKFIKVHEDNLPILSRFDVVYRIDCEDASYNNMLVKLIDV